MFGMLHSCDCERNVHVSFVLDEELDQPEPVLRTLAPSGLQQGACEMEGVQTASHAGCVSTGFVDEAGRLHYHGLHQGSIAITSCLVDGQPCVCIPGVNVGDAEPL